MSTFIRFTVPAVPIAQPRQRHRIIAGKSGNFVGNYTPSKSPVNDFKATVRMAAREYWNEAPHQGPVELVLKFVFPRPKKMIWKSRPMDRTAHTARPDVDNLQKSVADALSKLLWQDDSQVYSVTASKWVASGDEGPHVVVEVTLYGT